VRRPIKRFAPKKVKLADNFALLLTSMAGLRVIRCGEAGGDRA
jgi:hypothetical protein